MDNYFMPKFNIAVAVMSAFCEYICLIAYFVFMFVAMCFCCVFLPFKYFHSGLSSFVLLF